MDKKENEYIIKKHRDHMLSVVVDTLNIRDNRVMLRLANQAAKEAPIGEQFLYSVYVSLAGSGCEEAKKYLAVTSRLKIAGYLISGQKDWEYNQLSTTKRLIFIRGFWGRKEKDGD